MRLARTAFRYLKLYPWFSAAVVASLIGASIFDGISFSLLIPLMQSMTQDIAGRLREMPYIGRAASIFAYDQKGAISFVFIGIFFLLVLKNICVYFADIGVAKMRFGITRDARINSIKKLLSYDAAYFDDVKSGHIIGIIGTETKRMGDFLKAYLEFIALFCRVSAYIALLFFISWRASLAVVILILLALIPVELIMKKLKAISGEVSRAVAEYSYKLTEILSGIRLIKLHSTEEHEADQFSKAVEDMYRSQYNSNRYIRLVIPMMEVLIFGMISVSFLFIVHRVDVDMRAVFPFVATYLVVLVRMLTQINALNSCRSAAASEIAAFERYEALCDERGKRTIINGATRLGTLTEKIDFQDVAFSYANRRGVLKDVTISIPRKKITALVGSSGAGKSTLVNLISRFYDVQKGKIVIDGIPLTKLDLSAWRRRIGFVSQDVFLFNTSVKNNISYGHFDVSLEEIVKAAKAAHAHEFISELPDGYDTILGERGIKLSGGQKQRLSIARAIIHNPNLLILDEATSSLDTETERLIQDSLDELTKDRTVIAIAHRLSTIVNADNIIVLDNGSVAESGTHNELLAKNGLYKRLYEMQFRV